MTLFTCGVVELFANVIWYLRCCVWKPSFVKFAISHDYRILGKPGILFAPKIPVEIPWNMENAPG